MTAGAVSVPTIVPLRAPSVGKPKSSIDTNTFIELRTETSNAEVYYTTNGTKPDPFQPLSTSEKATIKYKKPFRLPAGKFSVKAIGVSSDGIRQSSVVTKTFEVEQSEFDIAPSTRPEEDDDKKFIDELEKDKKRKNLSRERTRSLMKKILQENDTNTMLRNTQDRMSEMSMGRAHGNETHDMMRPRLHSYDPMQTNMTASFAATSSQMMMPTENSQTMRFQRENDFSRCPNCFAKRPSDPMARHCNECGAPVQPIPVARVPSPSSNTMSTCPHCKSYIPSNTRFCIICEGPLPVSGPPQMNGFLGALVDAAVPRQIPGVRVDHVVCSKCGRFNNGDARFCDWCGTKPRVLSETVRCTHCTANNHAYAMFCVTCGQRLEPPLRSELKNQSVTVNGSLAYVSETNTTPQWLPVRQFINPKGPTVNQAVQTVGLFFPSSRGMKGGAAERQQAESADKKERKLPLSAISPGRGYWRQQADHICGHVKAHAQNDAEFRMAISEARMGKIINATVREYEDELALELKFHVIPSDKTPSKAHEIIKRQLLAEQSSKIYRSASMDSLDQEEQEVQKAKKKKPKRKVKAPEDDLSEPNLLLLKELSKTGHGTPSEIESLVEDGADPNLIFEGTPMWHHAVKNDHFQAIESLLENSAKVNVQNSLNGNTALHEAVTLGSTGVEIIKLLLRYKGDPQRKNKKNESPYDLAVKGGNQMVIDSFTSHIGESLAGRLVKSKPSLNF